MKTSQAQDDFPDFASLLKAWRQEALQGTRQQFLNAVAAPRSFPRKRVR